MKMLNTNVPSMYSWTMLLLSGLAAIESFFYRQIPLNLLASVAVTAVLSILIKILRKKQINFPYSAIISGLIIGSVAPIDSPILLGTLASAVAILSKSIKIKGMHVFNPATLGLVISLFVFSQGDAWWAANGYNLFGYIIPLPFVLVISNYKALKLALSASYLIVSFVIGFILSLASHLQTTMLGIISSLLLLNFYFAFIMVSEPKTSPNKKKEQILYGAVVAVLPFFLNQFGIPLSILVSLLVGNVAYLVWRLYSKKKGNEISDQTS